VASISAELDHLNVEDVDVTVSLSLPPGVRVVRGPDGPVHRLRAAASHTRLTWNIEADAATTADLRLDVKAVGSGGVSQTGLSGKFSGCLGLAAMRVSGLGTARCSRLLMSMFASS
jgi:hypothetical protein